MLAGKVEDMLNTVVRQIAFVDVRDAASTTSAAQGELTPERIGEIWLDVQRESLGPGDSPSRTTTATTGPTSRISSTRRSTSTPMPSAIAW